MANIVALGEKTLHKSQIQGGTAYADETQRCGQKEDQLPPQKLLSKEEAYAKAMLSMPTNKDEGGKPGPKRQRSTEQTPPEATYKKRLRDDQPYTSRAAAEAATPAEAVRCATKTAGSNANTLQKRQPTASYKDPVTGIKMAVLARDYPNTPLTTSKWTPSRNSSWTKS